MKVFALSMTTLLLLSACKTVPTVQVMEVCPKIPQLELDIPADALEQSFTFRIADFLRGKLSEPISYDLHSKPASPTQPKLNAN